MVLAPMVGSEVTPPARPRARIRTGLAALGIAVATVAVYAPVRDYPFLSWDDPVYIADNPNLRAPLGAASIARAFTEPYEANWIPLTWISLHIDAALFGIEPAVFHVENALLHLAAALVLLFALARATGSVGASAFVAAVFALHPVHVESVAWASQRKDCLSGLFFALAIAAHFRNASAPSRARLVAVWLAGGAAMLAKPVAVMLPVALLLLDAWPLRRLGFDPFEGELDGPRLRRALVEKLPLFAIAGLATVLTVLAQRTAGSIELLQLPVSWRVMNALWNYVAYLGMAFWPTDLVYYYPWPLVSVLPWRAGIALVALVGLLVAALHAARRERAVLVGVLWYGVMLLPVVGFVQVGMQARADRYLFWPIFGLALAVAFGVRSALGTSRAAQRAAAVAGVAVVCALAVQSAAQLEHWRSGLALYTRAFEVDEDNYFARAALGTELVREGREEEAIDHYRAAIALRPRWFQPHRDLGRLLLLRGELEAADVALARAIELEPGEAEAYALRADLLLRSGRPAQAAMVLDAGIARVGPGRNVELSGMRAVLSEFAPGEIEEAGAVDSEAVR